jgi:hypothetical protein
MGYKTIDEHVLPIEIEVLHAGPLLEHILNLPKRLRE